METGSALNNHEGEAPSATTSKETGPQRDYGPEIAQSVIDAFGPGLDGALIDGALCSLLVDYMKFNIKRVEKTYKRYFVRRICAVARRHGIDIFPLIMQKIEIDARMRATSTTGNFSSVPHLLSAFSEIEDLFSRVIANEQYLKGNNPEEEADNMSTARLDRLYEDLLSPIMKCLPQRDWSAFGRIIESRLLIGCSRVNQSLKLNYGHHPSAGATSMLCSALMLNSRLYRQLYLNALLQRVVQLHHVPLDKRMDNLRLSTKSILRGSCGIRTRHDDVSLLCLSAVVLIAWGGVKEAKDLLDFQQMLSKLQVDKELTPYSALLRSLISYLLYKNTGHNNDEAAIEVVRLALSVSGTLPEGEESLLLEVVLRIYATHPELSDEVKDELIVYLKRHTEEEKMSVVRSAEVFAIELEHQREVIREFVPQRMKSIHPAERLWVDWSAQRLEDPQSFGEADVVLKGVVEALVSYFDYAENRTDKRAWKYLHKALLMSDSSFDYLWRERKDWWIQFHQQAKVSSKLEKKRSEVFRMLSKQDVGLD